jgi:hypothetical protein
MVCGRMYILRAIKSIRTMKTKMGIVVIVIIGLIVHVSSGIFFAHHRFDLINDLRGYLL